MNCAKWNRSWLTWVEGRMPWSYVSLVLSRQMTSRRFLRRKGLVTVSTLPGAGDYRERRVRQIIADPDRPRYLNDALGNLPLIIKT